MPNANKPTVTTPAAPVGLTITMEAMNLPQLFDLIEQFAASGDPDRIVAIRLDEVNFCAQLDIAARPACSDTMH